MLIAAVGIILSIIGIFAVRTNENATIKQLLKALAIGTNLSSVLIAISTFGILYVLGMENWFWIGCSVIVGLLVGIVIGQATEYYTSQSYKPTRLVSESGLIRPGNGYYSGLRTRDALYGHPGTCRRGRYYLFLLVRLRIRLHERGHGIIRNRYSCRRYAIDLRYYVGYRRLRSHSG